MALSKKQHGVLKGMVVGLSTAVVIVLAGALLNPLGYDGSLDTIDRLGVAISAAVIPAIFLAASIGRLAKHRFFTPEDIDGGGLSNGTEQARMLQSLLQNTVEQALLAFIVYCAWSVLMPANFLSVVPVAAIAFGVGRLLFFAGYDKGAPSRALGFTLSFYPSMVMLVGIVGAIIWRQLS